MKPESEYICYHIAKLNLASGEISQLAINTYNHLLSPDGKKIAVFSTDKPEKHVVYNKFHILDTEGKTISSYGINGGDYTMWDKDSENILLGYSGDYRNKVLTKINIDSGETTSFKVEDSINPLYLEKEDILALRTTDLNLCCLKLFTIPRLNNTIIIQNFWQIIKGGLLCLKLATLHRISA